MGLYTLPACVRLLACKPGQLVSLQTAVKAGSTFGAARCVWVSRSRCAVRTFANFKHEGMGAVEVQVGIVSAVSVPHRQRPPIASYL